MSDIMIVSSYLGTASYDETRSLAKHGIAIVAPGPGPNEATSVSMSVQPSQSGIPGAGSLGTGAIAGGEREQAEMIAQVRGKTGMNEGFAVLCLSQNGWELERALKNFEEIRVSGCVLIRRGC
jgi:nuclear RNA export factor